MIDFSLFMSHVRLRLPLKAVLSIRPRETLASTGDK
jgi:hypothetical protein